MRLLSSTVALAAASLLGRVTASPNFEISKTSVDIDRHREKLDNGEIVVRVQRTQDLFSDPTADSAAELLLERDTHLFLKIQLDADNGKINVNEAALDIAGDDKAAPITVAGIKAETFRIPNDPDNTVLGLSVEEVQGLVDQMSTGIVGVEVKVESEPITPSVPVAHFDKENGGVPSIGAMTIRKVGLWIRITEVEGKSVPHTTAIYTPILQLIVTGNKNRVEKIETISIDGKAPVEQALGMPGPAVAKALPPVEGGPRRTRPFDNEGPPKEPQHHHHGHHHDGDHHHKNGSHGHHGHHHGEDRPSGIFGWLARTLDLSRWARPSRFDSGVARPPRKGCHGAKGMMRGGEQTNGETAPGKVVGHRPMLDNPFSGMADDDEGYASSSDEQGRKEIKHHMRPSHRAGGDFGRHGFKKHGRCGSFFKRMAIGFVYGLAMFGAIVMHPITLLAISAFSALALTFHVVRRIVIKKRRGAVRLGEEDVLFEGEDESKEPLMGEKEKEAAALQEVVVQNEDLPRYEERL
ncbi:hypothetical protein P389DRAFT_167710 [Cystobasidium minutum MCA 4210]|uniref:uncharacterized protein n=1 Tax=Cystobasidium minutum MCA 4210 TaxID=1397322 RepID=UPI0034CE649F|eukprot:jgi/Rhomi1/167710/fgenesh1_kg.2_\